MPIHARPWVKWLLRRYMILVVVVGLPLAGEALYALWPSTVHADPPAPPPSAPGPNGFVLLGQPDGTTWIKHDNDRGVTCYVFYYENPMRSGIAAGGISCVPDSQLQKKE